MDLLPFAAYEMDGARGGRLAVERKSNGFAYGYPGVFEHLQMWVWVVPEGVRSFSVWLTGGMPQRPDQPDAPWAALYDVPTAPGEAWGFDPGYGLFDGNYAVASYRNVFSGGHGGQSLGTAGCAGSALVRFPSGVTSTPYTSPGGDAIMESLAADWELWAVVGGLGGIYSGSDFAAPGPVIAAGPVPYPAAMRGAHAGPPYLTGEYAPRPDAATEFNSGGGGGGYIPGSPVHLGPGTSGTGLLPPSAAAMGGAKSPRIADVGPAFMPAEGPGSFGIGTVSLAYWVEPPPGGWHLGRLGWGGRWS